MLHAFSCSLSAIYIFVISKEGRNPKKKKSLALYSAFVSSGDFLTYLSNYYGELFSLLVWLASSTTLFLKCVCSYVSKATNTFYQESAYCPWDIQHIWNICVTPFSGYNDQFPQSQEKHVTEVLICFFFTKTTAQVYTLAFITLL